MKRQIILIIVLALTLTSCDKNKSKSSADFPLPNNAQILALGDSLTFGHGANSDQSWPVQLAQITNWNITNAGVNGDTSDGALTRLPSLLDTKKYDAIIIGIGGNDMLRGVSQEATISNIKSLIHIAKSHTNYVAIIATPKPNPIRAVVGSLKDADFYAEIAKDEDILLLDDVYSNTLSDSALRSDAIHANAKGYRKIAEQIAQKLKKANWVK